MTCRCLCVCVFVCAYMSLICVSSFACGTWAKNFHAALHDDLQVFQPLQSSLYMQIYSND